MGRRAKRVALIAVGVAVGLLALLVLAFATRVLNTYRTPTPSMEPELAVGTKFVTAWFGFPFGSAPEHGDVVVFNPPRGADAARCGIPSQPADGHPCSKPTAERSPVQFVARVVAVPGDEIAIRNHRVVLDGEPQDDPGVRTEPCDNLCNLPEPITVPPGHYYMLGDNRGESSDSRVYGPVPEDWLIGRKILEY